jgi:hypothetical protein
MMGMTCVSGGIGHSHGRLHLGEACEQWLERLDLRGPP